MCEYIDILEARGEVRGEVRGEARGEARGIQKGENRMAQLIQILLKEKKYKEMETASFDSGKRHELYQAYGV